MIDPIQTFLHFRFCIRVRCVFLYRITVGSIAPAVTPYLLAAVLLCELCMQFETRGRQTGWSRPVSQAARAFTR